MTIPAALIWDPSYLAYRFRKDHPFNPRRLELAVTLMESLELLSAPELRTVKPRMATDEELQLVHAPEYVAAVKRLGAEEGGERGEAWRWGLGTDDNPIFPGMHEATATVTGGTLQCAEMVMTGEVRRAFNVGGGLHHAHRDRASGFCIYNDLAVAIAWIRREYGARVLYIDYDGHHGDGVQGLFYDDPDVLTLSIHESGRYLFPGTGFVDELGEGDGYGYSLNLPVEPNTGDDSWMQLTEGLLPDVFDAFRPDVVVLQNGCDAHLHDPLTHLRCSTRIYEETVRLCCDLAERHCDGRVIATGGGGYAIWRVVPRAWSLVWATLTGQEAPDRIPRAWLERWQGESPVLLPERLRDEPGAMTTVALADEINATNRRMLESLRRTGMPVLRGWSLGF